MQVPFPFGGVSEDRGYSDREGARDAQNVRGIDPPTGRLRGGVRSGTKRYPNAQVAAAKVSHIQTITIAANNQSLTNLGNSMTQDWTASTTTGSECIGIVKGTQGDVYALDGNTGVMKLNRDGQLVWKLALAAKDPNHVVRALYVDSGTPGDLGTDLVLAGVSSGGDSTKALFWAYIQVNDNKTQKLWEIAPRGYVEAFAVSDDKLFVLMNFPDRNRAYVVVYDDYLTNSPTEVRRWQVPYPAHDMTASAFDKFIFTASDSNSNRDLDPQHPKATFSSVDWSITDLSSYATRVWANLDATKLETIAVEPRSLAYPTQASTVATAPAPDLNDGGNVRAWIDASGQGRSVFQTADKLPIVNAAGTGFTSGNPASRGAIYKSTGGPNGLPCLHFDGITCGMVSEAPASKDKANRADNLSLLPSYKGAQFAVFIVMRASADTIRRGVLWQGGTNTTDTTTVSRGVLVNSNSGQSFSSTIGAADLAGSVCLWEQNGVASDAASSATAATAPNGPGSQTLGGGLPDSGFCIVTWVCDGGVHDVFGTATRSIFRVNGHPCDRWQSPPFSTTSPTQLGYMLRQTPGTAAFAGDICEILVISDWYDTNDTQQALIGGGSNASNTYPDITWQTAQDSDLERIEGYLAHKWGIAHELPGGKVGWLTFKSIPNAADTVTVGSKTYTFVVTPAAANEVAIGATVRDSATALYRAINKTGEDITDYYRSTVINADFRCYAPVAINNTPHYALLVRSRNPNVGGAAVFAESTATVRMSWNSANASTPINAAGGNTGWYPHPFFLERTSVTVGGPPRTAGAATTSRFWMLRSPYPIIAAWDPANGKPKDVLTSGYDNDAPTSGAAGTGIGGVGYAVRVTSDGGFVYSAGPRQALIAAAASNFSPAGVTADDVDIRKLVWKNQAFSTSSSAGDVWTFGSAASQSPGALGYGYPRMDIDQIDNLWFPYYGTGNDSLFGFRKTGSGSPNYRASILSEYSSLTDHNNAYACACDTRKPKGATLAEVVFLGTEVGATVKETVFALRQISVTQARATPRSIKQIAIAGSQVSSFTSGAVTSINNTLISSTANFVDSAVLFGKAYVTDGVSVFVYDPDAGTFTKFSGSSSGGVPQRCQIIAAWNGSLVLARQAENPNQFFISKQGDPGDWDIAPYTPTQIQAIMGSDSSAGAPPDIINAFIPYNDDLAFIGGDHSIFRITGRPSPGGTGEIHLVSDSIGIAFGRAWCKDPKGYLYFFGSRGGVYRMPPGGIPEPLSSSQNSDGVTWRSKIERRLQAIDLSAYTIQMCWNDMDKGFHVIVCPYGSGGTVLEHYFWEEATGAWWPDKWATSTIQPTCIAISDGDSPSDRTVLIGCEDGYVRKFDKTVPYDDASTAIDSRLLIGPLLPKEEPFEALFSQLEAVLANDQGGCWCNVYVTDRADYLGDPKWSGFLRPGRNPIINMKARGSMVFVELRASNPATRWAFEQMAFNQVEPMGRKRAWSA